MTARLDQRGGSDGLVPAHDLAGTSRRSRCDASLVIPGIYAVLSACWIFFSDKFIERLAMTRSTYVIWSTYKGWGFVAVTACLLWAMLRGVLGRLEASHRQTEALNRELRALNACRQALLRADDEPALLNDVCRIICQTSGYRMAWVGVGEVTEGVKRVRPVAWAGTDSQCLAAVDVRWDDSERGAGPTGVAIRTGAVTYAQDILADPRCAPWHDAAIAGGFRCSIALPLVGCGDDAFRGALSIYSAKPRVFTEEEIRVLHALADDLEFGIRTLRARARRAEAEQALRESQQRLDLAIRGARLGTWDAHVPSGRAVLSARYAEILGYRLEEMDQTWREWVENLHPEDQGRTIKLIEAHMRGESELYSSECRMRRKDGSWVWVLSAGRLLARDEANRPQRIVGILMDVTERRRAEEAGRQHQLELAHLSRVASVGEMASSLAHELNQPLTAILSYAGLSRDLVRDGGAPPELAARVAGYLDEACSESKRAAEIVRRIRAYVRKQPPQLGAGDINAAIREAVRLVGQDLRHAGVVPELVLSDELPSVRLDPIQIEQVLINLMQNAAEAMSSLPPGERGLVVRSVYCATGRCRSCHENGVCVSVTDRGRAVDEAVAERIFESFFTTKPQGLGLGLGLAICRSIVEQHGGSIVAVRNPEGGMTFEFFLPVATADVTAGAAG